MKRLLAILAALVLLLTATALGEGTNQVTLTIQVEDYLEDVIGKVMADEKAIDALVRMVENASLRLHTGDDYLLTEVLLGDKSIADIALYQKGNRLLLGSSLVPNVAICLPYEAVQTVVGPDGAPDLDALPVEGMRGEFHLAELSERPYDTCYRMDFQDPAVEAMVNEWLKALDMDAEPVDLPDEGESACVIYTRETGEFALLMRVETGETCTDVLCLNEEGQYALCVLPDQDQANTVAANAVKAMSEGCENGIVCAGSGDDAGMGLRGFVYADGAEADVYYSHQTISDVLYGSLEAEVTAADVYVGAALSFTRQDETVQGDLLIRLYEGTDTLRMHVESAPGGKTPDMNPAIIYDMTQLDEAGAMALEEEVGMWASQVVVNLTEAAQEDMMTLLMYFLTLQTESASVGIIGGADGPTSIFVGTPSQQ